MTRPAISHSPAALQREIRRAGRITGRVRRRMVLLMVPALLGALAWQLFGGVFWLAPDWVGYVGGTALALLFFVGICGHLLALPAAATCRRLRREQFRRRLSSLPPEQQTAILLPLQDDLSSDTQKIVDPLINEFCFHGGELTPSAPPAGSGSELAAPLPAFETRRRKGPDDGSAEQ